MTLELLVFTADWLLTASGWFSSSSGMRDVVREAGVSGSESACVSKVWVCPVCISEVPVTHRMLFPRQPCRTHTRSAVTQRCCPTDTH